ncbi:hypothetical protein JVU11DRAFT_12471 [Chiua virens]|nr:hypothetical protein JVU11DRAFT_12471 [Chiua virens]
MKKPKGLVFICRGFECTSDELFVSGGHPWCNKDPESLKPRLLPGETRQGFMTTKYVPTRHSVKAFNSFKISTPLLQDAL